MAKHNHWLEQNDVIVPFNLIGRRKENVHCHYHVIELEEKEIEKLELSHVTNFFSSVCIYERIDKKKMITENILKVYFISYTLFCAEKKARL